MQGKGGYCATHLFFINDAQLRAFIFIAASIAVAHF